MLNKICIIGGGMSGLYFAYKMAKLYPHVSVTLLERDGRLGGRVHTVHKQGLYYEAGAGRMSSNHTSLMKLVKELGLTGDIVPMGSSKLYLKDSRKSSFDEEPYLKKLHEIAEHQPRSVLKKKTLALFIRENFSDSVCDDIVHAFGYNSEFDSTNAYDALENLKHDFVSAVDYYALKGGYSVLVDRLRNHLVKHGVLIKMRSEVVDVKINDGYVKYVKDGRTLSDSFNQIIFCVTKPDLMQFTDLSCKLHQQERQIPDMWRGCNQVSFCLGRRGIEVCG